VRTKNPTSTTPTTPIKKTENVKIVFTRFTNVIGIKRGFPLRVVSQRKIKGGKMYAITSTEIIPTIVTSASDFKAGCCANINIPIATIMIINDNKIEFLKLTRYFFPYLYS